jgi:uncharacterized repeat protein (TIGR02543 family)
MAKVKVAFIVGNDASWTAANIAQNITVETGSKIPAPESAPLRKSYEFLHWIDMKSGAKIDFAEFTIPDNSATIRLAAVWRKRETVSVEFSIGEDAVWEDAEAAASSTADVGTTGLAEPTVPPSKEGFTFDGWYTDDSYATPFDFVGFVVPNTSVTIVAKWVEDEVDAEIEEVE